MSGDRLDEHMVRSVDADSLTFTDDRPDLSV